MSSDPIDAKVVMKFLRCARAVEIPFSSCIGYMKPGIGERALGSLLRSGLVQSAARSIATIPVNNRSIENCRSSWKFCLTLHDKRYSSLLRGAYQEGSCIEDFRDTRNEKMRESIRRV